MNKFVRFFSLAALFAVAVLYIATGNTTANNVAQALPFSQNWTNIGLITTNDNWSGVLGIEGYLGQSLTAATGTDPQTIVATSTDANDLDIIANQTNPNTLVSGGVAEFDTLTNPVVALQGSGTADAPYVIMYLNTTGASNINVAYNLRDIDGGADNAVQPVALQYRVGSTGDFTNLPAGFVADASTGPNLATQVTPVSVTLPAAVNNQAMVQVRVITTNAPANDEWIGIDDISITAGGSPTPATNDAPVDMDGDGKTDYVVVRNIGGGPNGQTRWFVRDNATNNTSSFDWGTASDLVVAADFDGDHKDDMTVWRAGAQSVFYIFQSATQTFRTQDFGQTGDDPSVVADFNGDGKDEVAVYRNGVGTGAQSHWYYLVLGAPSFTTVDWGVAGDVPVVGDYDGDGSADFAVMRNDGAANVFHRRYANSNFDSVTYGQANDVSVVGDYDGDGKTDLAVARLSGGSWTWDYQRSTDGVTVTEVWGVSTDILTPGDFNGDGRTDHGAWRPGAQSTFYVFYTDGRQIRTADWGAIDDYPVANYPVQ